MSPIPTAETSLQLSCYLTGLYLMMGMSGKAGAQVVCITTLPLPPACPQTGSQPVPLPAVLFLPLGVVARPDPTTCHLLQEAFLKLQSVLAKYPLQSGSTTCPATSPRCPTIRCIHVFLRSLPGGDGLWPEKCFLRRAHSCSVADRIHNS